MGTELEQLLQRYVDAGAIPGGVALLGGADTEVVAVGQAAVGGPAMSERTIVRIQSMTKPVLTVAALQLVADGRMGLDDDVEQWLPELADRRVLTSPEAPLTETVPARHGITVRDLLIHACGYGMQTGDTPLSRAMDAAGVAAGPEPPDLEAQEWLERLTGLPLAFQPGQGWRYHHSYGVLGILLGRVTGRPVGEHLTETLFAPLGMGDTGYVVRPEDRDRLAAAYRLEDQGLVETEPAGGGFHVDPPLADVSHGELVSSLGDVHRFARLLAAGGRWEGAQLVPAELVRQMKRDQVPASSKTPDSFFPGFWEGTGWGYGGAVVTAGPRAGRYGWSGGLGTDFFVDPDGRVGILLTQVELGPRTFGLIGDFQDLS